MWKFALPLAAIALFGCVSAQETVDQQVEARQAACKHPGDTNLAVAKCMNAAMVLSRRDRDLGDLVGAARESVAAKLDRKEISEEDAKLQLAQIASQAQSELQRRNSAAAQQDAMAA